VPRLHYATANSHSHIQLGNNLLLHRLSTLPLCKNTPPGTPIRQYQTSPRSLLANLDDCLPRCSIGVVGTAQMLGLSREADDLAGRRLYSQFRRLHTSAARRARGALRRVCVVRTGGGNALHAHSRSRAGERIWRGSSINERVGLHELVHRGWMLADTEYEGVVEDQVRTLRLCYVQVVSLGMWRWVQCQE
jgi:hypothetical protein